jgi:hypothetical protein
VRPSRLRRGVVNVGLAVALAATASRARASDKEICVSSAEQSELLRRDHKLRAAHELMLVCARDVCPAVVRKDCAKWAAEVDEELPSIVLHVGDDAGRELTDVGVLVDGSAFLGTVPTYQVPMDPGEHVLRFEVAGVPPVEKRVALHEGERGRPVSVTLQALPGLPPPPPKPVSHSAETPSAPRESAKTSSRIPTGAWVFGGAGIAAMGAGAVLWIVGRNERTDLFDRCGQPGACAAGDIDSSKQAALTKLVVGDVAFGMGALAAGVAVWMGLWGRSAVAAPPVDVTATQRGAVVSYGARF